MKSDVNHTLLSLYCPLLARSIFIVEKAWDRKLSNRFWVDSSDGVSESRSSLNMMILILIEAIQFDQNTAIHNPNHWTLTGFQGTPFPNDTDSNTMHVVNFVTEGRNPNTAAVELACGLERKKWTQEIFKEAKAFAQFKGTTFLSGKARKQKAPPPSPSQERIMFWT